MCNATDDVWPDGAWHRAFDMTWGGIGAVLPPLTSVMRVAGPHPIRDAAWDCLEGL